MDTQPILFAMINIFELPSRKSRQSKQTRAKEEHGGGFRDRHPAVAAVAAAAAAEAEAAEVGAAGVEVLEGVIVGDSIGIHRHCTI